MKFNRWKPPEVEYQDHSCYFRMFRDFDDNNNNNNNNSTNKYVTKNLIFIHFFPTEQDWKMEVAQL